MFFKSWRTRQKDGKTNYKRGNMISGAARQDAVACINSYVKAKMEFTTEESRCVVVLLLEGKKFLILTTRFIASINWLDMLMRRHMRLQMGC